MKKIKIVLLLGFVGLFAASCGETSTDETMTADSLTTVPAADNTAGVITGGGAPDTVVTPIPDTTVGDTGR